MSVRISPLHRQRGIALMLVLWVLTLLTVMAVSMTATQRTELAFTENQLAETRFRLSSDAALAYTAWQLSQPLPTVDSAIGVSDSANSNADARLTTTWLPDGAAHAWTFADTTLTITVCNELSRINLNQADAALLKALLAALDVPEADAATLAAAIVDWRDSDQLKLLNGAEDDDYQTAGAAFGAKDEPFIALEELRQVLGMTPVLYQRLAPELTLAGEGQALVVEFASAAVLAATQGISLEDAQLQMVQRQMLRSQNRGGPLYRVVVTAPAEPAAGQSPAQRMEALLELMPGQQPPYLVQWRRFGLRPADVTAAAEDATVQTDQP